MSGNQFKTGFFSIINECTLFTRLTTLLFLIFYGLSFNKSSVSYLAVSPAYIMPPRFWVFSLFTFSFFEISFPFIIIYVLTIYFIEKLLLPLWGWIELIKFCALTNCLSVLFSVLTYVVLYSITYNQDYLFKVKLYGMAPLISALIVANRQQMGDNVVVNFKFGKFRNKHISICMMILAILLTYVKLLTLSFTLMYFYGFFISWIYLRFYQRHQNGNIGDLNDKFNFPGFFPYHLEKPISIFSNSIFALFIYMRICKKIDRRYDISSPTTISVTITNTDLRESERRKQMALKALNERLNQNPQQTNWPNLMEDNSASSPVAPMSSSVSPSKDVSKPASVATSNDSNVQVPASNTVVSQSNDLFINK